MTSPTQESDLNDDSNSDESTGESLGQDEREGQAALSFGEMIASTLWAALGVQNKRNRERDFTRGKATHFIIFGIGFTVLFVLGMYTLVSIVLRS